MSVRGIRGAISVSENSKEAIINSTTELLTAIKKANPGLQPRDLASIFFTVTDDLDAAFPALAARQMGWQMTPLLCMREIPVPDSLGMCVRVLLHWNTDLPAEKVRHIYLGEAAALRPDLPKIQP